MTEERALTVVSLEETLTLGKVLAESGFFSDAKQASQAVVKVLAGRELGFGPISAMTGIHIIQGKPAIGAHLLAAAVKRSGRYDYRVIRLDDDGCEIAFYQEGKELGRSVFDKADAQRAGLLDKATWKQFPRNLYFARAMSNGVRWYCPDATSAPVYTPEELGATVDGDGDVIDVPAIPVAKSEPAQPEADKPKGNGHKYTASGMFEAVNKATAGAYNAIPHLLNAIRIEAGSAEWDWPAPDDKAEWGRAYNLALAHVRKQTEGVTA